MNYCRTALRVDRASAGTVASDAHRGGILMLCRKARHPAAEWIQTAQYSRGRGGGGAGAGAHDESEKNEGEGQCGGEAHFRLDSKGTSM
jgi:hypothetical protein